MERFFVLDDCNTWYNWGLIVTAKDITPPEPKTNYVELDGMNGSLDLSESLTGEVVFKDRTLTASFWTDKGNRKDRESLLRYIQSRLHGKKVRIIEPDNPDHYFIGRVKVKSPTNTLPYMTFSIEATCEPWRYANQETERYVTVNGTTPVAVVINNSGVKTLLPIVTVTGSVKIEYNGAVINLSDGSYRITDIKLRQGVNVINVSGRGSVTFSYREACL